VSVRVLEILTTRATNNQILIKMITTQRTELDKYTYRIIQGIASIESIET
jgi:hypothetical protein